MPHRGLHADALISMVRDQENEHLIRDLGSHSQYLDLLHITFCDLFRTVNFRTISIYETKLSSTVKESIYSLLKSISLIECVERPKYRQMEQDWKSSSNGI